MVRMGDCSKYQYIPRRLLNPYFAIELPSSELGNCPQALTTSLATVVSSALIA
jgi:hypothetical protein